MFAAMGPEFLADPYPAYERLRALDPVLWVPGIFGIGAWVVTDHATCNAVLRDKRFGKQANKVLPPEAIALIPQEAEAIVERRKHSMLFRDPPDHTRLRGLVNQAFTPRTVERLRPHIAEIAGRLVDALEEKLRAGAESVDLIRELAFPLPIIVIAELLGVPPEDRDRFKQWSTVLTQGLNPGAGREVFKHVGVAARELDAYLAVVIDERRREPRADLISELVRVHEGTDRLSIDELTATCRLILTAGHETTVNLIGNGTLALLRNEAQRDLLAGDPSLLQGAVEEMLRFDSPVQMTSRFAYEACHIGGKDVPRGAVVLLLLGAANRDPHVFPEPQRFDVRRENAHANIAFGVGIHYCLGAPLARVEGEVAFGALLARLPRLALAEGAPLEWRDNVVLRGLRALYVTR
jgi:pimeloyl-[acyl-carrier protein] synthase